MFPVDNFGTVVGENPTPYGNLALWAVNSLSIVYWVHEFDKINVLGLVQCKTHGHFVDKW